ncbi:hypothetical protein PCK1_003190 [Pneumocystis canis]|nr:hypothetical protein PCK1_003190 [Pneumocystis canis]
MISSSILIIGWNTSYLINIASLIVQYEFMIDQCMASMALKNSMELKEQKTKKYNFFIYIFELPKDLPFIILQYLLNKLYTKIQWMKRKYQCFNIEDIIIINDWCGYSLFHEPYSWKTIYLFEEESYDKNALLDEIMIIPTALKKTISLEGHFHTVKKARRIIQTKLEGQTPSQSQIATT